MTWTWQVLVNFNGANGAAPLGSGVIIDANGNLFGTTSAGGTNSQGTVFEIANTATGYASSPTTLVSFNGANGAHPFAGLIADAEGNLFGTSTTGRATASGTRDRTTHTPSAEPSSSVRIKCASTTPRS